jgi:flagellar biosynthetic protein FliQ
MDTISVLHLGRRTLEVALLLSGPALLVGMLVGIVVTLLQAVTSIRDMTLSIVPKILAMAVTILLLSGWMLQVTIAFTNEIFGYIQTIAK